MKISKGNTALGQFPFGTTVYATSLSEGQDLITSVDDFVKHQSRFDRQARVNVRSDVIEVTEAIYLDYIRSQVMEWSDDEIAALTQIITSIANKFKPLQLSFPDELYLVKTTGQEEAHAAYTRKMNVIALPSNMVASIESMTNYGDPLHASQNLTYLENVIIHECFHIYSKNNAHKRAELYAMVGYKLIDNDIALPEIPFPKADSPNLMCNLKITNPDTPVYNAIIRLPVDAGDGQQIERELCPILMSSGAYDGGAFFNYLSWYFMVVDSVDSIWQPVIQDDATILYPAKDLMPQYMKHIGYNLTGELFHPDEVLAQNFVFVVNQPTLSILTGMVNIMN